VVSGRPDGTSSHFHECAFIIPYLRWLLRRADKPVMPESPALFTFAGFAANNVAQSKSHQTVIAVLVSHGKAE
jgi:hypothetical protein